MERLLQGLRGLLRLTAVTLQALLGFQVATLAGFGVFFGVSFAADHGVLLHSLWVLGGCRLPRRPWSMPLRVREDGVTSVLRAPRTSCFFLSTICGINAPGRPFPFPHCLVHASVA